jgi:hypothetical protein
MAAELGKSGYEGEKDIAAQKEIYAAFLELMMELVRAIPGFSPRIDIQKGQGLTIERKALGQAIEDVVEVEQKPIPEAIQNEPAKKPGIETLYGVGQNNLTPNDIKAISAIIAGKQGDTVIGGEGLIIKYNGKTLFETDERGKISLHTAVSPQIREKFAALQAGQPTPTPQPVNAPSNGARQASKVQESVSQSQAQEQVGNLFAKLVNSLPAMGVPKVPEEKQTSTINTDVAPQPANNIVLPPNFNTEEKQVAINQELVSEELDITVPKFPVEVGEKDILQQTEEPLTESVYVISHDDIPVIELPPDTVVEEQIVEYAGESPPGVEQVEPTEPVIVSKKSILENVGNYVVDRAKKDSQRVADATTQMASKVGTNVAANLAQGFQSIPDVINDQYRAIKTRLTNNVMPEDDPKLKASINTYMDQVDDMFDKLEQDDPNLGLSASRVIDETIDQDADEPDYEDEPNVEIDEFDYEGYEEQRYQDGIEKAERDFEREHGNLDPVEVVSQLPDMGDGNTQSVAIENPEPTQTANTPKPAKLQAVSIEDALRYMSRRDDGAKAQDGKGYNFNDTGIGKRLIAQIDRGEALDSVQAQDALKMLKKYHKQFAEGGIKLPTWKSVQTQYSEPAYSAEDQRAIFTRQQKKLDATMPPGQQQAVLKAVYKVHTLNMPEQNYPVQPGRYELELPTGSKLVNQLDDLGVNNLSIEKNEERILLGGVTMPGNYTPASTIANAMPELRQLRTFLTSDLKLSSEPVNAIPLNQPLPAPTNKNEASESVDADAEEKPYTITPTKTEYKIIPGRMATEPEPEKKPAISRGGR